VQEGDTVVQGQLLGHVGMTGRATGPHLHWALSWRGKRLDPRLFAAPAR
jgi:murein DD-endopeptidase MepM/ murein hydrolase activator NlpD